MCLVLTPLEETVLDLLLDGDDPIVNILRAQYQTATVVERKLTGVGFFLTFRVPRDALRLDRNKAIHFGDVQAEIGGLKHGAGFVVHVLVGAIDCLEGYSYDEPWPQTVDRFRVSYIGGTPRDFASLWKK